MLPNVRLLIAAMLASILVLMCGFGVFATFRVRHEPIAHLPAAMAPLQLVAEIRAAPATILVARETADQHSRSDTPVSAPEQITPSKRTIEQTDPAEFATQSEPAAAPQPNAATDIEPSAAAEPEKEAATMAPAEQPSTTSAPPSDLSASAQGGDRSADITADAAASLPLGPDKPAATPESIGAGETTTNTTRASEAAAGEAAPADQTTRSETPPTKVIAVPTAETGPAAVASLQGDTMPDSALDRSEAGTLPKPPLPRARPAAGDAKHVSSAQRVRHTRAARAADERLRSAGVMRPKRTRVVVRSVRAVQFTAPYYAQAQYAQSIDQSYGYGQSNFQGASVGQEQIAVRRVVRLTPARLAARRANSAIGGPFVRAPNP